MADPIRIFGRTRVGGTYDLHVPPHELYLTVEFKVQDILRASSERLQGHFLDIALAVLDHVTDPYDYERAHDLIGNTIRELENLDNTRPTE